MKKPFIFLAAMLSLFYVGGCAAPKPAPEAPAKVLAPPVKKPVFPDFILVTVHEGDTLSSLAAAHLNDPSKDWLIADFNNVSSAVPGQELIIPLKPYDMGGITLKGYQTVPVLSYHKFSEDKFDKMTVTAATFEAQMKLLKDKGYRVITIDQLFEFLDLDGQIPEKSVVITIDDGWRSTYDIALPILKKYGYPATLFVYTDMITGSRTALDWNLVVELSKNNIDIQCHTKTHRNLAEISAKESFREYFDSIDREIAVSLKMIREKVNREPKYLAYPYGDTTHLVIALLKKYGFRGAFTVKRGANPFFINNYIINRSMIYGEMDIAQFEKNLTVSRAEALK